MKNTKPLGQRSYGSIPHLIGSRLGPSEHHVHEGQDRICTTKTRDRNDLVIVQEKLDGSNVAVAKVDGKIFALSRAGYEASTSPYRQHHLFAAWVNDHEERFYPLLNDGERIVGEWLALAHGTKYELIHEPFVAFDLMTGTERKPLIEFLNRVGGEFVTPRILHLGKSISISEVEKMIAVSGHGAVDDVEGAMWRVERSGKVDFLAKYVRQSKVDGCYLENELWNENLSEHCELPDAN